MKIIIFVAFLAIASSSSFPILEKRVESQNPTNRTNFDSQNPSSKHGRIHLYSASSSNIRSIRTETTFPGSQLITAIIITFFLQKKTHRVIFRAHLIELVLFMLLIKAHSQCPPSSACLACNAAGSCTSCFGSNVYLTNILPRICRLCSIAMSGCNLCTSNSACTDCSSGFHLTPSANGCTSCGTTINNCLTCSKPTTNTVSCTACATTTFLFTNLTTSLAYCPLCRLFLDACLTCINATVCTFCVNDTYALTTPNNTYNTCQSCPSLKIGCKRCNFTYCFECQYNYQMQPTNVCLKCSNLIDNCVSCINSTFCTVCVADTYFLDLDHLCYICDSKFPHCQQCTFAQCRICKSDFFLSVNKDCLCKKGKLISNICNPVSGCNKAVIYKGRSVCKGCNDEFNFNLRTLQCDCKVGVPVGDTCTYVFGCITLYTNRLNENVCLMCDLEQNFYIQDQFCYCKEGYSLDKSINKCTDTCGDGKVFQAQCDDGNPHDGDGCSNSCLIENLFRCYNGSFNSSSKCLYMGSPFGLKLFSIYKKPESNTGVFVFTITEWIPLIEHIQEDLESIEFNTTQEDAISEVKHDKGKLYVTVQYFEDLEGNMAKFSIDLANFFLTSRVIVVDFVMISETAPLVIMDYPPAGLLRYLEWVLLAAVSIAILLLTVGSLFHKMVGLETIVVFQTCFLLPYVITDGSVVLSCFKVLSYSTGYGKQLFYDEERDKYLHESNVKLQLSKQFFEAMALNSVYFVGIAILMAVLRLIAFILQKKKRKNQVYRKLVFFLYHRMLFPTSMTFLITCFISLLSNNLRVYEWQETTTLISETTPNFDYLSKYLNFILSTLLTIIIMGIASLEMVLSLRAQQYSLPDKMATEYHPVHLLTKNPDSLKVRPSYIGLFLSNLIITICILTGCIIHQNRTSIYLLIGLVTFSTVLFCVYKPYQPKIHTAGLLAGQFILVLFCSGLSVKQYFLNTHRVLPLIYELVYCSLIAVMLLVFDILSLIRLIYAIIQDRKQKFMKTDELAEEDEFMEKVGRSKYDKLINRKWKMMDEQNKKVNFEEKHENEELKQIKSRLKNNLSTMLIQERRDKIALNLSFHHHIID